MCEINVDRLRGSNNLEAKLLDVFERLLSCKSITPNDGGALLYISDFLAEYGFECHVSEFGYGDQVTKNLYAVRRNAGKQKNICFAGHVDVVPPGDLSCWCLDGVPINPFALTRRGDIVYGRGAVDMKGALACMLVAISDYIEKYAADAGTVSVLFTSDEEGRGVYGTKMMLEHIHKLAHVIDFAIVGEPTNDVIMGDMIKIGRRGSINFVLDICGIQGHVAYPDRAKNPIKIIGDLISTLYSYNRSFVTHSADIEKYNRQCVFESSNLEITSIDTDNDVTNIIPGKIQIKFNIRYAHDANPEAICNNLRCLVADIAAGYKTELVYEVSSYAFLSKESEFLDQFASIVENATSVPPQYSTTGGTSDARFIQKYCPVVEFGLLCETAHKINEHTKISHLQMLYNVYYHTLCEYHK